MDSNIITKEFIEAKISETEKQQLAFLANANACDGAIQAFKLILEELKKCQEEKQ